MGMPVLVLLLAASLCGDGFLRPKMSPALGRAWLVALVGCGMLFLDLLCPVSPCGNGFPRPTVLPMLPPCNGLPRQVLLVAMVVHGRLERGKPRIKDHGLDIRVAVVARVSGSVLLRYLDRNQALPCRRRPVMR